MNKYLIYTVFLFAGCFYNENPPFADMQRFIDSGFIKGAEVCLTKGSDKYLEAKLKFYKLSKCGILKDIKIGTSVFCVVESVPSNKHYPAFAEQCKFLELVK
jgi:hypothetical protein